MLSDRTLQLAMQAQEVALIFAGKRPENYEIGMQAYKAAQKIIAEWDRQQLSNYGAVKLGELRSGQAW